MTDLLGRILVVDDSPDLCGFLELLLQDKGYEVRSATSLRTAREILAGWQPSAVIADVRLPDAAPFAVLDLLNGRDGTARIPVLLCTGAVNEVQTARDWLRQENIAVVVKPFEIDDLLHGLNKIVRPGVGGPRPEYLIRK